jgi:peptidoglycan/xylan/chitin deacetylase (PgdA/CDA1 family)
MQLSPLYPVIYQILQPMFPGCLWSGKQGSRTIALTFDDGPHPIYTPRLLKVLDSYAIPVSFFWLGVCVARSPIVAREVFQRGHWVGLHGFDHKSFPLLTPVELKQSLEKTQMEIAAACQVSVDAVRDVRPPNGLFTPETLTLLKTWNYRPVMWSVVPEDWTRPGISTVVQRVLQQVKPGSIIVLHDGHCGGEDVAETADELIRSLLKQNYQFVTINQLWEETFPA